MSAFGHTDENVRLPDDRRVARTRAALGQAFVRLLSERGYAAMSVAEIAAAADVGRSTFYEHFPGKEALLAQSIARPFRRLADIVGSVWPAAELLPLLAHFRAQRTFGLAVLKYPTRPIVARALAALIEPVLAARMARGLRPVVPLGVIAAQLAAMQLSLVEDFVIGHGSYTALALAEALVRSTRAGAAALLGGPSPAEPELTVAAIPETTN